MKDETYNEKLKRLIDEYVHSVYDLTIKFSKEEIYGTTSQFRRAAMSVMLNYVEGYARNSKKHYKQFLLIAYTSLQETVYLIDFTNKRSWINNTERKHLLKLSQEISKMIWSIQNKL